MPYKNPEDKKAWRLRNKERLDAESKAFRDSHREEIRANDRDRYHSMSDEQVAVKREQGKDWRENNRGKFNQCVADHYQRNSEAIKAYKSQYRKDHAEEILAYKATYRAMRAGATLGNAAEIREIYRKAQEEPKIRCYLCGDLIPMGDRHVDHITPLSKGGEHRPSNLAVACKTCNLKKSAKLPAELGLLL